MVSPINQADRELSVHESLMFILRAKLARVGEVSVPRFVELAKSHGVSEDAAQKAVAAVRREGNVVRLKGRLVAA